MDPRKHLQNLLFFYLCLLSYCQICLADKKISLPEKKQAALQEYFDEIYFRIRLKTDPKSPPRVQLVQDSNSCAYVFARDPTVVHWNIDYLLSVLEKDVIAGTYAHELTHFEPEQLARTAQQFAGSKILNEAEAQSWGIIRRICREGELDKHGEAVPAVYSLEAIIREYSDSAGFHNQYLNFQTLGSLLKVYFAKDRYVRKYPGPTKLVLPFDLAKYRIQTPGGSHRTPVDTAKSPVRLEVAEAFETHGKDWGEILRLLRARLLDKVESKEAVGILNQIDGILELDADEIRRSFKTGGSGYERLKESMASLPSDFFSSIHAAAKKAKFSPKKSFEGLFDAEVYFSKIAQGDPLKKESTTPIRPYTPLYYLWLAGVRRHLDFLNDPNPNVLSHQLSILAFADDFLNDFPPKDRTKVRKAQTQLWNRVDEKTLRGHLAHNIPDKMKMALLRGAPLEVKMEFIDHLRQHVVHRIAEEDPLFLERARVHYREKGRIADQAALMRHIPDEPGTDVAVAETITRRLEINAAIDNSAKPRDLSKLTEAIKENPLKAIRFGPLIEHLKQTGGLAEKDYKSILGQSVSNDKEEISLVWLNNATSAGLAQNDWLTFKKKFPETEQAAEKFIAANALPFLSLVGTGQFEYDVDLPWRPILRTLSGKEFLLTCALNGPNEYRDKNSETDTHRPGISRKRKAEIVDSITDEFLRRLTGNELETEHALIGLRLLSHNIAFSGHPRMQEILNTIQARAREEGKINPLNVLHAVSPASFETPRAYVRFVSKLLEPLYEPLASLDKSRRKEVSNLCSKVKGSMPHVDPHLKQDVLDELANKLRAVPAEKKYFEVERIKDSPYLGTGVEYTNAIHEGYTKLSAAQRFEFSQWLRGKAPHLTAEVSETVWLALLRHGVSIRFVEIEPVLRARYDALPPLARTVLFQVFLDGEGGLLQEPTYRAEIDREILEPLPKDQRAEAIVLLNAAVKTLPPSYESVIRSTAFAESGHTGSPEEALCLIFRSMGPLVQKFGQNLAFDSHLPESYRRELQKLWDEGDNPGWWNVQELIRTQWGNIEKAGFQLHQIRNIGTTEIAVELVRVSDGKHFIASVMKPSLLHGAEIDAEDLRKFVAELTSTPVGKARYGFLSILVEDAIRTMKMELNREQKPRMTVAMREGYIEAAKRLGGTYSEETKKLMLAGWTIESPIWERHALGKNKELITQEIAPGVPMKSLAQTDPALYKQLTGLLLQLENEGQSGLDFPIDKDRMPGQVLVDVATLTVTLLDHGQAKLLRKEALASRDAFIESALVHSPAKMAEAMKTSGFQNAEQLANRVCPELLGVATAHRPLAALSLLWEQHALLSEVEQETFWDLVHAIRAKARLAHWGELMGGGPVENEWTAMVYRNLNPWNRLVFRCGELAKQLGLIKKPTK